MKAYARICLVVILCVISLGQAWAADLYIRSGATGKNDGSDWINAFTDFPSYFVRGNTYYVADGSYKSTAFNTLESGSLFITIKKATVSDHGTNTGWMDSFGDGTAVISAPISFNSGYWIIDGSSRTNIDGVYGFKIDNSAVRNSKCVDFSGQSNIILKYIDVQGDGVDSSVHGDGFYMFGNSYVTISYVRVSNVGRAPFIMGGNSNVTIEHSLIERNSSDAYYHSEAIAFEGDSDFTIRYNIFRDIEGTGCIVHLSRGSYKAAYRVKVYGNVAYNSTWGNMRDGWGDGFVANINKMGAYDWEVYNNTIVNIVPSQNLGNAAIRFDADSGGKVSGCIARNNMWYNVKNAYHNGGTFSHNWYYNAPHASEANIEECTSSCSSFFMGYTSNDFRLAKPTASGFILNSPYNLDMNNKQRGADGRWDRGAYEYNGDVNMLQPPSNLRLSN